MELVPDDAGAQRERASYAQTRKLWNTVMDKNVVSKSYPVQFRDPRSLLRDPRSLVRDPRSLLRDPRS